MIRARLSVSFATIHERVGKDLSPGGEAVRCRLTLVLRFLNLPRPTPDELAELH